MKSRMLLSLLTASLVVEYGQCQVAKAPPAQIETAPPPAAVAAENHALDMPWHWLEHCTTPGATFWVNGAYTVNWIHPAYMPPLVTSSPVGVPIATAGVLGQDTTNVLLGDHAINFGAISGMRFTTGVDFAEGFGLNFAGFFLQTRTASFNASGGDANSPSIARPFFDPITNSEAAFLVAFPGRFTGSIDSEYHTGLWGVEMNFTEKLGNVFSAGVGFRYLDLNEDLTFHQSTTAQNAPALTFNGAALPLSDSVRLTDSFVTRDQFYGPQFSLRADHTIGRLSVAAIGKLALGATHPLVITSGQSEHVNASGQVVDTASGGFLAIASNAGSIQRDIFTLVPELEVKGAYQLTGNLSAFISYDFLYWNQVAHPGEQVDRTINLTKVPTAAIFDANSGPPNRPAAQFQHADFWIQSVQVGLQFSF
jgi:Putative beta barrel porin-7 (BBP7)